MINLPFKTPFESNIILSLFFVVCNACILLQKETVNTYVYNKEELPLNKITAVNIGWIESPDKIYVSKVKQLQSVLQYCIYFVMISSEKE